MHSDPISIFWQYKDYADNVARGVRIAYNPTVWYVRTLSRAWLIDKSINHGLDSRARLYLYTAPMTASYHVVHSGR